MSEVKIIKREALERVVDGRLRKVYRIWFQLPDGTIDWIDVPEDQYDPNTVKSMIESLVAKHAAIKSLKI